MLDFFKKKGGGNKAGDGETVLDGRVIARLMRHFPIGTRVEFYPEYRKEILLDSVVIAYAINDALIYSVANLICDEASGELEFDDQAQHYLFGKITRFNILLPVFSQSEAKLDYIRREELHKIGGLVKGNTITLMAEQRGGQVPVLETTVEKRSLLKHGYYANQTVAYLNVDAESLLLSDQRAHLRLKTQLPATLQVTKKGESTLLNCTMVDFSDLSLRLALEAGFAPESLPKEKSDVVVAFNLPGRSEYVSLVGTVFRIEGDALVIMLSGIVDKGRVAELGQIEMLKIKANLLQHFNTNLAR